MGKDEVVVNVVFIFLVVEGDEEVGTKCSFLW